jgi:iron complex transport system permease protein
LRRILLVAIAATALLAALFGSLAMGSVSYGYGEILAVLGFKLFGIDTGVDAVTVTIIWQLRLARTILAGLAGAALGVSGAVLQGLFRNPLADPYAIGVSSGASLGAVISIVLGAKLGFSLLGSTEIFAFGGALSAALAVYGISRFNRRISPTAALLLAGVAVGSFISALVSLIVTLNDKDLHTVFFWMLGGFGGKGWKDVAAVAPAVLVALAGAFVIARPLDLLGAGEEAAGNLGLDVKVLRRCAVAIAALGAAAAVSAGGVIGFVGLLGPHMARLVSGSLHRRLLPLSAISGAVLLMLADAVARSILAPVELPVGIVTALIGAPLFLRLLASPKEGRVI